ncbi:hypothetical protein Fmac_029997 [Flemingia macrophylla]|uniref:Uncharacterized protein n=1 Tax=Flemingia macrophylla TaxID=520843 RepID=A0ABD1LBX2_9FABA
MQELEAVPALASVLKDLSLHRHEAAEALGAIGSDDNVPLLKSSLDSDPAQEVRETCELALQRIQHLKDAGNTDELTATDVSPFKSVDPAAPAASCSSVDQLNVAYVLGQLQDKVASAALSNILKYVNEHPMVRHEAAEALGSIAGITANIWMIGTTAASGLSYDQSVALLEEFVADPEPCLAKL